MLLSIDDEIPVRHVPNIPDWSENFCVDGYDPNSGVAFWVHCGRWAKAPELWREQVLLFLPNGEYLIHRSYGYRPNERGVSGPCLSIDCDEPFRRLTYRYRGPAGRLSEQDLADAPVRQRPIEYLEIDLAFEATHAVWDFGSAKGQVWATSHYEQPGQLTGTIVLDGVSIPVNASGYRDHSRGPRDQTNLAGHCWIHANFGDWAFAVFGVRVLENRNIVDALRTAVIFKDGEVHPAEVTILPYLSSLEKPPASYELTLGSALGEHHISVEIQRSLVHSVEPHFDCFDGLTPTLGNIGAYQQPSKFTCNGVTVPGYTERSARL